MPKLIDYECLNCGHTEEGFEGDNLTCPECPYRDSTTSIEHLAEKYKMRPIFSQKNNQQRVYIRDERK